MTAHKTPSTLPTSSAPVPAIPQERVEAARASIGAAFAGALDDLCAFVRIPSVSQRSFDQSHVEASAEWVADKLRGLGMESVEILRVTTADGYEGAPAVVARRPAREGAPTVLLYAHHDVQPPGRDEDWDSQPFEPTLRGERLFGRGAADDKAGVIAHLTALGALDPASPLGVTVFIEGEEEVGSPTFQAFLAAHAEKLRADVIVVADSSNWKVGGPALTTSLRGLVDATVEVRVLEHAVHSGMFGGPVLDAVTVLSRLLATLHDADGSVAVPGLVVGAEPTVDYPEADFRADAGLLPGAQFAGTGSLTGRLWVKPAISVIGMDVTPVEVASNTLIPAARAKLSVRLAPGQDPALAMQALEQHVTSQYSFGAVVTFVPGERGKPFQAPRDAEAMRVARAAFAAAWGTDPVDIGVGGSIPFIADLLESFPQATILVTGVEDPDTRAHGANESLHVGEFEKVCVAELLILQQLAEAGGAR
ncbi:dipeptidase [Micrococcales bacterium 31B]|nr:dipeptidase [Micrococcales bacterium 31B]